MWKLNGRFLAVSAVLWIAADAVAPALAGQAGSAGDASAGGAVQNSTFEGRDAAAWFRVVCGKERMTEKAETLGASPKEYAGAVLLHLDSAALPVLYAALEDPDAQVRYEAANLLVGFLEMGIPKAETAAKLRKALGDPEPLLRMKAVIALTSAVEWTQDDVPKLLAFLLNEAELENTLWHAGAALGLLGERAPDAVVPQLSRALRTGPPRVRRHAVVALGRAGPKAVKAVPSLIDAMKNGGGRSGSFIDVPELARADAAVALGRIGHAAKDALPQLQRLADEGDTRTGMAARYAIAAIAGRPRPQVVALIAVLKSQSRGREFAAEMLGQLGAEADIAVPALVDAIRDREVLWSLVPALGKFGPSAKQAVPALMALLDDRNMDLPMSAAHALGRISSDARVVAALRDRLKDRNIFTRFACLGTLAQLADRNPEARQAVEAAAQSDDKFMRLSALLELKKLGRQREGSAAPDPAKPRP